MLPPLSSLQLRPAALLCYETDAACCHRRILAERMAGFEVMDLAAPL